MYLGGEVGADGTGRILGCLVKGLEMIEGTESGCRGRVAVVCIRHFCLRDGSELSEMLILWVVLG